MAVAVMLACFVLLYVVVLACPMKEPLAKCWRSAFLMASVLWSTYMTAVTESLSLLHMLTLPWVFALWLMLAVALQGYVLWCLSRRPLRLRLRFGGVPASLTVLLSLLFVLVPPCGTLWLPLISVGLWIVPLHLLCYTGRAHWQFPGSCPLECGDFEAA